MSQTTTMPSLVVIGPLKGETEGVCAPPPAYVVPNDPSLNRVKSTFTFNITSFSQIDLR